MHSHNHIQLHAYKLLSEKGCNIETQLHEYVIFILLIFSNQCIIECIQFSLHCEFCFSDAVKSQVGEPVEGIRKDSYRSVGRAHLVNAEKILVAIVAAECWFTTVVFF